MQCYETVVSFLYFGVCDSDAAVNDANNDDDGNHDDGGGHGDDDDDDTTLVKHSEASSAAATSTESQIADLQQYVFLLDIFIIFSTSLGRPT